MIELLTKLKRIERLQLADPDKLSYGYLNHYIEAHRLLLRPDQLAEIRSDFAPYLLSTNELKKHPTLISNDLIDQLCLHCFPTHIKEEAQQQAGFTYAAWMINRKDIYLGLLLALMKKSLEHDVMDWESIITGLAANLANCNNYGTYQVRRINPHYWQLEIENTPRPPHFILGTLLAGAESLDWPGSISFTTIKAQHYSFRFAEYFSVGVPPQGAGTKWEARLTGSIYTRWTGQAALAGAESWTEAPTP